MLAAQARPPPAAAVDRARSRPRGSSGALQVASASVRPQREGGAQGADLGRVESVGRQRKDEVSILERGLEEVALSVAVIAIGVGEHEANRDEDPTVALGCPLADGDAGLIKAEPRPRPRKSGPNAVGAAGRGRRRDVSGERGKCEPFRL